MEKKKLKIGKWRSHTCSEPRKMALGHFPIRSIQEARRLQTHGAPTKPDHVILPFLSATSINVAQKSSGCHRSGEPRMEDSGYGEYLSRMHNLDNQTVRLDCLVRMQSVFGFPDVVIEVSIHSMHLRYMEPREIGDVLLVYEKRIEQMMSCESIKYVKVWLSYGKIKNFFGLIFLLIARLSSSNLILTI